MSGWTFERIELLRRYWAEGLSASRIAACLGGVTRNAVIGKVHRLELPARAARKAKIYSPRPRSRAASSLFRPTRLQLVKPKKPATMPRSPKRRTRQEIAAVMATLQSIPGKLNVDLLDLQPHMCRWMDGDPKEDGHFCGRHRHGDLAYCAPHASVAFQWRR